jgi:hypothetical protein
VRGWNAIAPKGKLILIIMVLLFLLVVIGCRKESFESKVGDIKIVGKVEPIGLGYRRASSDRTFVEPGKREDWIYMPQKPRDVERIIVSIGNKFLEVGKTGLSEDQDLKKFLVESYNKGKVFYQEAGTTPAAHIEYVLKNGDKIRVFNTFKMEIVEVNITRRSKIQEHFYMVAPKLATFLESIRLSWTVKRLADQN